MAGIIGVVLRRSLGQKVGHESYVAPTAGRPCRRRPLAIGSQRPRMPVRSPPTAAADPTDLSAARFWSLFGALMALAALPVLRAEVPPLFDYPNHLARMYLLLHLPDSEPLRRFYEQHWAPVPNLAMDAI